MGKFLIGVIATLVALILIALGVATLGLFPTPANVEPSHLETHFAMGAVDASMDRRSSGHSASTRNIRTPKRGPVL